MPPQSSAVGRLRSGRRRRINGPCRSCASLAWPGKGCQVGRSTGPAVLAEHLHQGGAVVAAGHQAVLQGGLAGQVLDELEAHHDQEQGQRETGQAARDPVRLSLLLVVVSYW